MSRRRRSAPWQVAGLFAYEREAAAYEAAVDACLTRPDIARRLGKRPQATAENVRAHMLSESNVRRALEPCGESRLQFRTALRRYESTRTRVDYLHDRLAPQTLVLALLALSLLLCLAVAPWAYVAVVAALTTGAAAAVRRHHLWRMRVRHNVGELALSTVLFVRSARVLSEGRRQAARPATARRGPADDPCRGSPAGQRPRLPAAAGLFRYGLRIMEIEEKTQFFELTDISRQMILEELAETLAGFRTLLGKEQWTAQTSGALLTFRSLTSRLQHLCPCPSADLQEALEHFAFYDIDQQLGASAAGVPESTRLLIDEASTYVLFSLTLLDIFGRPDLARRRAAASRGTGGDPDLAAQARQELEISPYSARHLIAVIRTAWGLPSGPSGGPPSTSITAIPGPRPGPCPIHARAS